jgi:hypothetical protein
MKENNTDKKLGPYREPTQEEKLEISNAEKELLSCPFCGSKAVINYVPPHGHVFASFMPDCHGSYFIECTGCTAAIAGGHDLISAVAEWNQRKQGD